jgi:hypothetical protein
MSYDYYYIIKINHSVKILKKSNINDVLRPIIFNHQTTNELVIKKVQQMN